MLEYSIDGYDCSVDVAGTLYTNGQVSITYCDGDVSRKYRYNSGSGDFSISDGVVTLDKQDGTHIKERADGMVQEIRLPNGASITKTPMMQELNIPLGEKVTKRETVDVFGTELTLPSYVDLSRSILTVVTSMALLIFASIFGVKIATLLIPTATLLLVAGIAINALTRDKVAVDRPDQSDAVDIAEKMYINGAMDEDELENQIEKELEKEYE